jgi:hypothetical protein
VRKDCYPWQNFGLAIRRPGTALQRSSGANSHRAEEILEKNFRQPQRRRRYGAGEKPECEMHEDVKFAYVHFSGQSAVVKAAHLDGCKSLQVYIFESLRRNHLKLDGRHCITARIF